MSKTTIKILGYALLAFIIGICVTSFFNSGLNSNISHLNDVEVSIDSVGKGPNPNKPVGNSQSKDNNAGTIISIISLIATIVSTYIAVIQSMKVRVLRKQKHRLSWDDMEVGINQLFKEIEKDYKPEIVICLSERGTAIVTMGFAVFGRNLPIFTAFWQDPNKEMMDLSNMGFIELNSRGRKFFLPEVVLNFKDKKLLVIDDWAFSGQAMTYMYNVLKNNGVSDENIRCAALVVTPPAKSVLKPANSKFYHYYEFPDNDFYFPWGKAT
jgi:hypoxanthine phosphoribosyltransferase